MAYYSDECAGRRNGKSIITRLAKELAGEKIWGIAVDISCKDVTDEVISFISQMAPKFGFVREYDDNHPSILKYRHKERYDLYMNRVGYIPGTAISEPWGTLGLWNRVGYIPGTAISEPWGFEGWR